MKISGLVISSCFMFHVFTFLMIPDQIDIEQPAALLDYLRATARIELTESPGITVLSGGVSNRTVLLERDNGQSWVIKQALPKLRVAVDWFSDPRRIGRE